MPRLRHLALRTAIIYDLADSTVFGAFLLLLTFTMHATSCCMLYIYMYCVARTTAELNSAQSWIAFTLNKVPKRINNLLILWQT